MEDLRKQRDQVLKGLQEINEKVTEDVIENATKEELEEYLQLVDEILSKLEIIDNVLEESN